MKCQFSTSLNSQIRILPLIGTDNHREAIVGWKFDWVRHWIMGMLIQNRSEVWYGPWAIACPLPILKYKHFWFFFQKIKTRDEIKWEKVLIGWDEKVDEEIKWETIMIGWDKRVDRVAVFWTEFWMLYFLDGGNILQRIK